MIYQKNKSITHNFPNWNKFEFMFDDERMMERNVEFDEKRAVELSEWKWKDG